MDMDRRQAKTQLDTIVGKNIRRERTLRNITRDDLAVLMNLTSSHMGLIERGERGATATTLVTLSKVLEVSTDSLLAAPEKPIDEDVLDSEWPEVAAEANRMKIKSYMNILSASDLEVVISLIYGLIKVK